MKFHPFWQLLICRVRETWRTPEALFWVFIFPLVMIVALGLAFRSDRVETIIVDVQEGPRASEIAAALSADERFQVTESTTNESQRRLRVGKTELVIATQGESGDYEYIFDPTRPGSLLARNSADDVLQTAAGRKDIVQTSNTEISETGSRYIDFLIPGLIGMGLMGGGLWGVGYAVTDMRIRQLLKRYMGTPMKRPHFLGAMMGSRLLFMIPETLFILLIAWLLFGVTSQGNYLLVGLIVILAAVQFGGIGLLVASRARTVEAVSGLMNLVMVPMWIGSGIFFSPDRFPEIVQPVISILPLTPVIRSLRQVMLEGAGLAAISPSLLLITGWGLISFVLALILFRWD